MGVIGLYIKGTGVRNGKGTGKIRERWCLK